MSVPSRPVPSPVAAGERSVTAGTVAGPLGRGGLLLVSVGVLALVAMSSLAVGSETLSFGTAWHELWHETDTEAGSIVRGLRFDRTLVGVCVGAALGLAGALMQALTRNPLADPGLLGVTAGSAAAVVTGITLLGLTAPSQYLWLSLLGAALASVAVYVLGSGSRSAMSPVRLVLAGAAVTAVLTSYVNGLTMLNQQTYDAFRFWVVGTLVNRDLDVLMAALPFLGAGTLLALLLSGALNAVALGDDTSRALGVAAVRTRVATAVAITCLCGAATAVTGPIGFVGLTVPHLARAVVGPDQRWLLPFSMVFAAILLLAADVVGRVVAPSGELQVGIMTAVIGVPVFVFVVRRRKLAQL
ncbi:FecCD family ABC transporter permease [Nocardioides jensenii]|uniref:FecCD family ABC transporter permease n=1 Tax=Nocardioides jensenii TaxID=1843 RepID=UPI00082CD85A|nr:iron chelate uptake ABC transporter family permease subunit [Nocardioides jensenii]